MKKKSIRHRIHPKTEVSGAIFGYVKRDTKTDHTLPDSSTVSRQGMRSNSSALYTSNYDGDHYGRIFDHDSISTEDTKAIPFPYNPSSHNTTDQARY